LSGSNHPAAMSMTPSSVMFSVTTSLRIETSCVAVPGQ
jgi:hypothetical protein